MQERNPFSGEFFHHALLEPLEICRAAGERVRHLYLRFNLLRC